MRRVRDWIERLEKAATKVNDEAIANASCLERRMSEKRSRLSSIENGGRAGCREGGCLPGFG
tara:strand:+ start:179 stop:364 length:186 start_codon:yes stop_codon:yes gene_type:complete